MSPMLWLACWLVVGFFLFALADFLRCQYQRWRLSQHHCQLARDVAWRSWMGRVRALMIRDEEHTFEVDKILSRDAEWFHGLWENGVTPENAIIAWREDSGTKLAATDSHGCPGHPIRENPCPSVATK